MYVHKNYNTNIISYDLVNSLVLIFCNIYNLHAYLLV